MKLKSPTCSTGHGTGVTHCVDLRVVLERDRYRVRRKQVIRRGRRHRGPFLSLGAPKAPRAQEVKAKSPGVLGRTVSAIKNWLRQKTEGR